MNVNLRIFLFVCILIFLGIIVHFLKERKLNLRYTLIWLLSGIVMLFVVIFPQIIDIFAKVTGIIDTTNAVFMLEGMFILMIILSLTSIVSNLNDKNRELIQKIALLENFVREKNKEKQNE